MCYTIIRIEVINLIDRNVEKYVKKHTRNYRTKHINLKTKCDYKNVPYAGYINNRYARMALSMFLKTTLPISRKIHASHLCNGSCFNPLHLYWGTAKENMEDKFK